MSETWKDIIGYEGLYKVSDQGRIKSVKRMVKCREGVQRVQNERIKGCSSGTYRHVMTTLWRDNKQEGMYVHRMVLRAFNGEPKDGMTASHIDGDPTNNNINNLVWELHKDNILRKNGHETMLRGQDTPSAKLLDNQVRQIKEFLQFKALSQTNIARLFNVSNSAISAIHTGKTWRHI